MFSFYMNNCLKKCNIIHDLLMPFCHPKKLSRHYILCGFYINWFKHHLIKLFNLKLF